MAEFPSWGADGRIALVVDGAVATLNHDGSDLRVLPADAAANRRPYGFPGWAHTVTG